MNGIVLCSYSHHFYEHNSIYKFTYLHASVQYSVLHSSIYLRRHTIQSKTIRLFVSTPRHAFGPVQFDCDICQPTNKCFNVTISSMSIKYFGFELDLWTLPSANGTQLCVFSCIQNAMQCESLIESHLQCICRSELRFLTCKLIMNARKRSANDAELAISRYICVFV